MTRVARIVLLTAILFGLGLMFWQWQAASPPGVRVQAVARGSVEASVANTRAGTVEACRRARLSLPIGGQIARLPIQEGDRVAANDVLLELWSEDLEAELQLARAQVVAETARAREQCTRADVAARDARRMASLHKQNLISENQYDQAQGESQAQAAGCQAARAASEVAQQRVLVQQTSLERMRLRAPFAGIVAEINGELGEFVTPSPIGIATPPAVDLIDGQCVYISAPIDEVDGPRVQAGMEVRIHLDAFADQHFPGRVRRVAPYVTDREKQARTVDIEVDFLQPPDGTTLLPGYSADVEVMIDRRENTLRIPTQAVMDGNRVWVYEPVNHTLALREIRPGLRNWQYTEVEEGLQEGEQIVLSVDREGLEEGARVQVEDPLP